MTYIWNLYKYHIDTDVQMRVYPLKTREGRNYSMVCLKNMKTSQKYVDDLELLDAVTGERIRHDASEGYPGYVCAMDRSFHVMYKGKYVVTFQTTNVWKSEIVDSFQNEIIQNYQNGNF